MDSQKSRSEVAGEAGHRTAVDAIHRKLKILRQRGYDEDAAITFLLGALVGASALLAGAQKAANIKPDAGEDLALAYVRGTMRGGEGGPINADGTAYRQTELA